MSRFGMALVAVLVGLPAVLPARSQQVPDTTFAPSVGAPAYRPGAGPIVRIDEAHWNFHTATGRYAAFARLAARDGYRVERGRTRLTRAALDSCAILVISNALPDTGDWVLPTRHAFTRDEVGAVREWVERGGSLLLIADHMPFPGAAEDLAHAFGVAFQNGYALDRESQDGILRHTRANGRLRGHAIREGRNAAERVDSLTVFTGQAFRLLGAGEPLLVVGPGVDLLFPLEAGQFGVLTPRVPAEGLLQGVAIRHGRGRVAMFGEAAMFSAQSAGPRRVPMGFNDPAASQNAQYALNVLHWLSGALD